MEMVLPESGAHVGRFTSHNIELHCRDSSLESGRHSDLEKQCWKAGKVIHWPTTAGLGKNQGENSRRAAFVQEIYGLIVAK